MSELNLIPFPVSPATTGIALGRSEPELNLRLLWSLARYLEDCCDKDTLPRAARAAGIEQADLDGKSRWVDHDRFERFLAAARAEVEDEQAFKSACAHRLHEGYGPFRFILWAMSPRLMYVQAINNIKLISSISDYQLVEAGANHVVGRYTSQRPESRLMCLSRQAQIEAVPTLWQLPPAQVEELSCIARGDESCTYRVRWYSKLGWVPTLTGAGIGAAAALAVLGSGMVLPAVKLALPALGAAVGYILDLRRTNRLNLFLGEEINGALRQLAQEDAEARRELLAIAQRQQEWVSLMEAQVADRTAVLENVVERIHKVQEQRTVTIRGFSHDLRNPLSVLRAETLLLRSAQDALGPDGAAIVDDHEHAVEQMEHLLGELMDVANAENKRTRTTSETVEIEALTERLRRRLRALVHGREIRTSVFRTREAPATIVTDVLLLDRVLDNLLTNAAKYTERGSILLEVGGTPGFLTIKVSDTGRGIEEDRLSRIFAPGGSDAATRAPRSFGVGLSVVLRLLAQIGGRLEVMSRVGQGTTFWAHFPERTAAQAGQLDEGHDEAPATHRALMERVVTIRKVN
jgi:signal transduction histidine kinase